MDALDHSYVDQSHQPMFKKPDNIENHYQTRYLPSCSSLELLFRIAHDFIHSALDVAMRCKL